MSDSFKMRRKETFLKNKAMFYQFRSFFTPKQASRILIMDIAFVLYALISIFTKTDAWFSASPYNRGEGFVLLGVALVCGTMAAIGHIKKLFKSSLAWERYFEVVMMIQVLGYLCWGFDVLVASVASGRQHNYIMAIIVFAGAGFFFYLSVHHYVVVYVFCLVVTGILIQRYGEVGNDPNIVSAIILLGGFLTLGAIVKSTSEMKEYALKVKAHGLTQELEANNEELIAINEDLENLTEQLRENNETQRLFTASMNHELRSPLNGVIGLLQVIRDNADLDSENADNIEKAITSSKSLLQIVNDLLDYSKMGEGSFTILHEKYDLKEVIDGVDAIARPGAMEKDLPFMIDVDDEVPRYLTGDGVRLQQVITNLVTNGIKYTDKGKVELSVKKEKEMLVISVCDTGQGLSKESLKTLFEPFTRFNEAKNVKIKGTGLGLSIVKTLVTLMEGDISVSSEVDVGSTFIVSIPIVKSDDDRKYGEKDITGQDKAVEETPDFGGKAFLCVDDNKVNHAVFKGMFKGTGAEITLLADGESCLEEIKNKKYDIIFMDHMMPGMDGVETYKRIRNTESINQATKVVMMTGNTDDEDYYKELGVDDFVAKPVIKEDLYSKTKSLLLM